MGVALLGSLVLAAWTPGLPEAIQGRQFDEARRLLASGADLGRRDHRGYTALMLAIEQHEVGLAGDLIEAGVDLGAQDNQRSLSAIRLALMYGQPAPLKKLLAAGADPNERYPGGQTPLLSVGHYVEMIEALIAAGADVNAQDEQGFTVLMRKSMEGPPDVVRVLLSNGARTDLYNAEGQTAMSIARTYGNAKVRDLFCDAGVPDVDALPPRLGDPAYDFAARALARGEFHLVMGLAAAEIDLKGQVAPGLTLLHYAARWGAPDAVSSLLEAVGPATRVDVPNGWGHTALWYAVLAGRAGNVRLLARQGASVRSPDARQRTPLDAAILNDDSGMVRVLLELGAPVGPLQLRNAVTHDRVEVLDALVPYAKPEDLAQFTAGNAASVGAKRCVVYLFRLKSHDGDLAAAAQHGDDLLVQELVRLGANVHGDPQMGWSPMTNAAARGLAGGVRAMLDAGANPNEPAGSGSLSALSAAASAGHAEVVRILCDAGADTEFEDYRGYKILGSAARAGHLEAVKALLAGGARLNAWDRQGLSAWQHAVRGGHDDVAKLLVDAGSPTVDFETYLWRRIARDAFLTLVCWVGVALSLGGAAAILRPAAVGFIMGTVAALLASTVVGLLSRNYEDAAVALDPPYSRLIAPGMAAVLVMAVALHGAALVAIGKLCRPRILGAIVVLLLSLGAGALAWRSWFPFQPLPDLVKLTGLPFLAAAAALETRHRNPRLAAAGPGPLLLAVAAALVPLLRGLSLIRPSW